MRVFVPNSFYYAVRFPELLNAASVAIRACGASAEEGFPQRSKEYLLFGRGLGTLLLPREPSIWDENVSGYFMLFERRQGKKGVKYWEVNSDRNQSPDSESEWMLEVSNEDPGPDVEAQRMTLAWVNGDPGQWIYVRKFNTGCRLPNAA